METEEKALYELKEARGRFFPQVSLRQTKRYASPSGVGGVRIGAIKIGAKTFVSRAAVEAFVAALFSASSANVVRRYRANPNDVDAYSTLDKLGIKWNKPDGLK